MRSKYDRPDMQKIIFGMIDRYVTEITLNGAVVIGKTREELAQELEVSQVTLKKYMDVWAKKKGMPYKLINNMSCGRTPKNVNSDNKKIEPSLDQSDTSSVLETMSKFKVMYIDYKNSNNLSKHTINNINLTLDRFYDYVADESSEESELSLNDMTKYFLSNYLNKLTNDGMAKNTQKLHVIIIKNFFKFIAEYDPQKFGFLHDKFNGVKIKTAQKEKVGLLQLEQQRLIVYLKILDSQASYLPQRNALLIKVLLYAGLRISELINIKWTDISKTEDKKHGDIYSILVKGKGDKERFAYLLSSEIKNNLDYLEKSKGKSEYIFVTTHGNKCNRTRLYVVIKKIMNDAGIAKAGLHIFRHTFARNMVDKDINLATIKDLLGHSNIAITAQFYAKSNENAKRNALFK